jgi:tetratricopeptide (TPR) repeat protein
MSKKKRILLIYFFLAAATLTVFWQVNDCDFINYDDDVYISRNGHIQDGITIKGIRWAFTTDYADNWHPLTWISHMADVQLFGMNPRGHHLTNLLFHLANTLLLFFVFHRMTKAIWQSAFIAALFALHPLHVESVAWVAERKDVLSTFFWILTVGAYGFYVERPGLQRYLTIFVFFTLGLMAKPMLVTLPFVMLLLDYWPLKRFEEKKSASEIRPEVKAPAFSHERKGKSKKKHAVKGAKAIEHAAKTERTGELRYDWTLIRFLLWEKIPFFAMSVVSSIVTFIAQKEAVQSIEALPLGVRFANAFVSYILYIGKMIWPSNLAVSYPHPGLWPLWQVLGAVFLLIAATILVIREAKRFPYLSVGWLWYVGTLVPVIGLIQVGSLARADRYTYIPLIGLFLNVAWGIPELLKGWRYRKKAFLLSSAFILLCLSIVTWTQVGYWRNSITLFDHALKVTDRNINAYHNRAIAYMNLGNYRQAIEDYDKAIELNPKSAGAYYNRAIAYENLGNYRQAMEDYDKAIELNPKFAEAYYNRAIAYGRLGNYRQAMEDTNKAIELNPKFAKAYNNRAIAYMNLGSYTQAIEDANKAIELNPKYANAYNNRAIAYGHLGNYRQAMEDANKAIELNPKYANAYYNRAIAYEHLGNYRQATEDLKTAARLGNESAQKSLKSQGMDW